MKIDNDASLLLIFVRLRLCRSDCLVSLNLILAFSFSFSRIMKIPYFAFCQFDVIYSVTMFLSSRFLFVALSNLLPLPTRIVLKKSFFYELLSLLVKILLLPTVDRTKIKQWN